MANPEGLRLSTVAPSFTVNDVDQSLAFYRDVLGFAVGKRWEEGGRLLGVELSAGPVTFMIGQDDWKKGRDRVKGEGFRLYCTTDQDVDRLAARVREKGGRLLHEPRDDEELGGRMVSIEDPDGFKMTITRER